MKLDGFGIAGYRSFGPDICRIGDLSKINIFIGKNNSGKSNILRFLGHFCHWFKMRDDKRIRFDESSDYNDKCKNKEIKYAIQIKKGSSVTGRSYSAVKKEYPKLIEECPHFFNSIWLDYKIKRENQSFSITPILDTIINPLNEIYKREEIEKIFNKLIGQNSGKSHNDRLVELAKGIYNTFRVYLSTFDLKIIEEFRKITDKGDKEEPYLNGSGLIEKIRNIQNPSGDNDNYKKGKKIFKKVNGFLKELLGEKKAYLEIPAVKAQILVKLNKVVRSLESFGTGIHQLIILAMAVIMFEDSIFCIEEPEIYLHPELQKKFIQYLKEKTNNQYLISTHSNAFFDIEGVNIYHCQLVNGYTTCELKKRDSQKCEILTDLGYRASDILQSNCIIWVEGPSDRIYINDWIKRRNEKLIEGIHYSIMFYGGRLLSHLTVSEDKKEEHIKLRKLNQNVGIVIDSDKKKILSTLNATKQRILEESVNLFTFSWVTHGKEIENYIPLDIFNKAVEKVHSVKETDFSDGMNSERTKLKNGNLVDKVKVARAVVEQGYDYRNIIDLNEKIDEMIEFIKKANNIAEKDSPSAVGRQ